MYIDVKNFLSQRKNEVITILYFVLEMSLCHKAIEDRVGSYKDLSLLLKNKNFTTNSRNEDKNIFSMQ